MAERTGGQRRAQVRRCRVCRWRGLRDCASYEISETSRIWWILFRQFGGNLAEGGRWEVRQVQGRVRLIARTSFRELGIRAGGFGGVKWASVGC